MEVKNKIITFLKMSKDIIPEKIEKGDYYDAKNIRFISSEREILRGFHLELGNLYSLRIPSPRLDYNSNAIIYETYDIVDENITNVEEVEITYQVVNVNVAAGEPRNELEQMYYDNEPYQYKSSKNQRIIGYCETTKGVVLFTTDNKGFDCIWYLKLTDNDKYNLQLLYMRNMGFSIEHPIESLNNFESEKIDKVYWVDTKHQIRHINLEHSKGNGDYEDLIDLEVSLIDAVSSVKLTQPKLLEITSGGTHTAGMIQYAYNVYKTNGSMSMLSPLTDLIPLGKEIYKGGNINEIVSSIPVIEIKNIDKKYDNIIVYAIKYTSLNKTPEVNIIEDRKIPVDGKIVIYDTGYVIRTTTLENLLFINNSINFPGTIASKDNVLIHSDFKEKTFKLNIDTRAYQFPKTTTPSLGLIPITKVYDNIEIDSNNNITGQSRTILGSGTNAFTDNPFDDFDSINNDYDKNAYIPNTSIRGGEGKYLKFTLSNIKKNKNGRGKFFKDNEIYRLGIKFYNIYGQATEPKWICDFKAPQGNLKGKFNTLTINLKPEFFEWLNNQDLDEYNTPVSYKVLIAERTNLDKTILATGLVSPTMYSRRNAKEHYIPLDRIGEFSNLNISQLISTASNNHFILSPNNESTFDFVEPHKTNFVKKTKKLTKYPSLLLRNAWLDETKTFSNTKYFELLDSPMQRSKNDSPLFFTQYNNKTYWELKAFTESPSSASEKLDRGYRNHQFTKMMNLYCPEAIFGDMPVFSENCTLEVRYGVLNTENATWSRLIHLGFNTIESEPIVKNALSPYIVYNINNTNTSIETLEWISGSDSPDGYHGLMNNPEFIAASFQNGVLNGEEILGINPGFNDGYINPINNMMPTGYGGRGMFSNYFLYAVNDTQHFTVAQMFYRKYGDNLETVNNYAQLLNDTIDNLAPGAILPNIPGLIFNNSNNAVNTVVQNNNSLLFNYNFNEIIEQSNNVSINAINTTNNNENNNSINSTNNDLNLSNVSISNTIEVSLQNKSNVPQLTVILDGKSNIVNANETISINTIVSPNINNPNNINTSSLQIIFPEIEEEYDLDMIISSTVEVINNDTSEVVNDYYTVSSFNTSYVPAFVPGHGTTISTDTSDLLEVNGQGLSNDEYKSSFPIYQSPIHLATGQSTTTYNSDSNFKIANNYGYYINEELGDTKNVVDKAVRRINANGISSIAFVLNPKTSEGIEYAIEYENVVKSAKFKAKNKYKNGGSIYCDIVKSKKDIYFGNIYGGNSYEDKLRTNYLEIGDLYELNGYSHLISNPGDTFVQDFKFLRVIRGDIQKLDPTVIEHEEIVEYLTETTIDLYNRSDMSTNDWDAEFSYSEKEYMNYNPVYSQLNKINESRALDYTFKQINNFNATIRSSMVKTPNELYDSFLQTLVNEEINLDGKYGKVNRLLNYNDKIFAIQDKAISVLNINPKVQVQTAEGTELRLGTGQILDDYKYITTNSGSLKWSCIATPFGIYYLDHRNQTFNNIGESFEDLTKTNHFMKFFKDNVHYNEIKYDNFLINQGITLGYDKLRTDIYFTYKVENKTFTLSYNAAQKGFSSFYDYDSDFYIPLNNKLLCINPNENKHNDIYTMYENKVGKFYGNTKESYITFITSPEYLVENIFFNLEYIDRAYTFNNERVNKTFDTIRILNDYQDSTELPLVNRVNIRLLNRKWRLNLPRENNKVNRIRSNWAMITLKNKNEDNLHHEVNDIVLHYRPNYKDLQ